MKHEAERKDAYYQALLAHPSDEGFQPGEVEATSLEALMDGYMSD